MPPRTIKSAPKVDVKKEEEKLSMDEKVKKQKLEMDSLLNELGIDGDSNVISDKKVEFVYDAMDETASAPIKPEGDIMIISSIDVLSEVEKLLSLNGRFNRMVINHNGTGGFSTICDDIQTYVNHSAKVKVLVPNFKFVGKGQLLIDWEALNDKLGRFGDASILAITFRPKDMMWTVQHLKTINSFDTFGDYDKKYPIKQKIWDEENIEGKIRYTNKGNPLNNMIKVRVAKIKRIMDVCSSFGQAMIPLVASVGDNNIGTLKISLQAKGDTFSDEIFIEGFDFANGKGAEAYIKSETAEVFNSYSSDDEIEMRWGINTVMLLINRKKTESLEYETKTAIPLVIPKRR